MYILIVIVSGLRWRKKRADDKTFNASHTRYVSLPVCAVTDIMSTTFLQQRDVVGTQGVMYLLLNSGGGDMIATTPFYQVSK